MASSTAEWFLAGSCDGGINYRRSVAIILPDESASSDGPLHGRHRDQGRGLSILSS
jgi:hypothetical protein